MTTNAPQGPARSDSWYEIRADAWGTPPNSIWINEQRERLLQQAIEEDKRATARREQELMRKQEEKERKLVEQLTDRELVARKYNMPLSDREFVDWLRGAVDLVGDEPPTKQQWNNIKSSIARVIAKRMLDIQEVQYENKERADITSPVTTFYPYISTTYGSQAGVIPSTKEAVASLSSEIAALKSAIANTEEETK